MDTNELLKLVLGGTFGAAVLNTFGTIAVAIINLVHDSKVKKVNGKIDKNTQDIASIKEDVKTIHSGMETLNKNFMTMMTNLTVSNFQTRTEREKEVTEMFEPIPELKPEPVTEQETAPKKSPFSSFIRKRDASSRAYARRSHKLSKSHGSETAHKAACLAQNPVNVK